MARIIFFGSLGDRVENAEQAFDIEGDSMSARQIFEAIGEANPPLRNANESIPIKVALNKKLVDWEASVSNQDELAFLPPVTGG